MEVKNLQEAKDLIERYRSITAFDFDTGTNGPLVERLQKLTGFGSSRHCTLCIAIGRHMKVMDGCETCIHILGVKEGDCNYCVDHESYEALYDADTIPEMLEALSTRADYLQTLVDKVETN